MASEPKRIQVADCVDDPVGTHVWVIGKTTCVKCGVVYENPGLDAWLAALNDGLDAGNGAL